MSREKIIIFTKEYRFVIFRFFVLKINKKRKIMNKLESSTINSFQIPVDDTVPNEIKREIHIFNFFSSKKIKDTKSETKFGGSNLKVLTVYIPFISRLHGNVLSKIKEKGELYSKIECGFKSFLDFLNEKKERKVRNFKKKVVESSHLLLATEPKKFPQLLKMKQSTSIWECHCVEGLSRLHCPQESRRSEFETLVIKKIQKRLPFTDIQKRTIHIASIGAGGCFQELIFHGRLSETKGYQIHWTLIDKDSYSETLTDFLFFAKIFDPNTSFLSVKQTGENYLKKFVPHDENGAISLESQLELPDVILSVDLGHGASSKIRELISKIKKVSPLLIYAEMDKVGIEGRIEIKIQ